MKAFAWILPINSYGGDGYIVIVANNIEEIRDKARKDACADKLRDKLLTEFWERHKEETLGGRKNIPDKPIPEGYTWYSYHEMILNKHPDGYQTIDKLAPDNLNGLAKRYDDWFEKEPDKITDLNNITPLTIIGYLLEQPE